jgi:hypothetical protein
VRSIARDTLASESVLRRLEAIEKTLIKKRLNVSEVNKALKRTVSKIVMDAERGTLTFHWHRADEPSEPITFAWPRGRNGGQLSEVMTQPTPKTRADAPTCRQCGRTPY